MEIREAILRAADSIEANLDLFDYYSTEYPKPDCGTPGCALGWIAFYDGARKGEVASYHGHEILGVRCSSDFYRRMTELAGDHKKWSKSAKGCAKTLRAYADKYHPKIPKTDDRVPNKGIPDNVLSIFREDIAA